MPLLRIQKCPLAWVATAPRRLTPERGRVGVRMVLHGLCRDGVISPPTDRRGSLAKRVLQSAMSAGRQALPAAMSSIPFSRISRTKRLCSAAAGAWCSEGIVSPKMSRICYETAGRDADFRPFRRVSAVAADDPVQPLS